MSFPWQEGLLWLTTGLALGWAAQWQWHRRWLQRQTAAAEAAAAAATPPMPLTDTATPVELARLSAEVARLAEALAQRDEETRRLGRNVALLDQQVMKLHLAHSPIAQPRARAA